MSTPSPALTLACCDKDRKKARESLKNFVDKGEIEEVTEDLVETFLRLRQSGVKRVNAAMLQRSGGKDKHKKVVNQAYWLAPKSRYPDLPTKVGVENIVPGASVIGFPKDIEKDSVWIVDQAVPRSAIGPGLLEWVTTVGNSLTVDSQEDGAFKQPHTNEEDSPAKRAKLQHDAGPVPKHGGPNSQKERPTLWLLCEGDTLDDVKDEDVSEKIAQAAKASAEAGRLYNSDKQVMNTVENCVDQYVDYICTLKMAFEAAAAADGVADVGTDVFIKALPAHVQLFLKFIVKTILQCNTLAGLKPLTRHFGDVEKVIPGLVPRLGLTLASMANFDHTGAEPFSVKELSFAQRQMLKESNIWKRFDLERFLTRFAMVKAAQTQPASERHALVVELVGQASTMSLEDVKEQKAELDVVGTLLSPQDSITVKAKFLLKDASHFDLLKEWCPAGFLHSLEELSKKNGSVRNMEMDVFLKIARFFKGKDGLTQDIAQPLIKAVVLDYGRLSEAVVGAPTLAGLKEDVFAELASEKLGIAGRVSEITWAAAAALPENLHIMKAVLKIVGPTMTKRMLAKDSGGYAALIAINAAVEAGATAAPADGGVTTGVDATGDKTPAHAVPAIAAAGTGLPPASGAAAGASVEPPPQPQFVVGQYVITHARKFQDKYDRKHGRIVKMMAGGGKAKVLLMDGSAKGKEQEFDLKNLTIDMKKGGSQSSAQPSDDPSATEAKGQAKAQELFGDVSSIF